VDTPTHMPAQKCITDMHTHTYHKQSHNTLQCMDSRTAKSRITR